MDILVNKSYKQYAKLSRYSPYPYYYNRLDNKYIYGTTSWLNDNTTYSVYTVNKNDTWDSMALHFYNDPTKYWIICDFNRITNCLEPPIEGEQIKVPVISTIEFNV